MPVDALTTSEAETGTVPLGARICFGTKAPQKGRVREVLEEGEGGGTQKFAYPKKRPGLGPAWRPLPNAKSLSLQATPGPLLLWLRVRAGALWNAMCTLRNPELRGALEPCLLDLVECVPADLTLSTSPGSHTKL